VAGIKSKEEVPSVRSRDVPKLDSSHREVPCLSLRSGGRVERQGLTEKAAFLEAAGVDRKDVAAMLGTTYGSISEMLSKAKRSKKGGKKNGKRKTR
jgi:hypothetical protein